MKMTSEQKFGWHAVATFLIVVGTAFIGVALYALFSPKSAGEPESYYLGLASGVGLLLMFGVFYVVSGILGFVEVRRLERGDKPLFR